MMSEIFFDTFTVELQMFEAAAFRSQLGQVFWVILALFSLFFPFFFCVVFLFVFGSFWGAFGVPLGDVFGAQNRSKCVLAIF